ncbi:MAG: hypothetical protein HKM06_07305 [Spirochaetales bacterium]|nr:hypothetical protein [Spirochaetales bacterium]
MSIWNQIVDLFNPSSDQIRQGESLARDYQAKGYLALTQKTLLSLPDSVIAVFYKTLAGGKVPVSPVSDLPDSGWLASSSACFVNVRATGLREGEFGNFIQASKLLPAMRVRAIHLAPFTEYEFGTIYAVRSLKTIAPQVVHTALAQAGLRPARQLDAFIQAAHVLGKAVGFDIEPHTAQFSVPALEVPEAFRWIKVYPKDRQWLDYMLAPEQVYTKEVQERLASEIRSLIGAFLKERSLHTFDEEETDTPERVAEKRAAFQDAIQLMIREGYWTVPLHSWDAEGLPRFAGYNLNDNYPIFQYLNRDGKDSASWAYHVVSPFQFYYNIPLQGAVLRQKPEANPAALDLFCSAFVYWRERHHFDFVRHDSVDHVFDSIFDEDGNWPLSDRPTPVVLMEFIRRSKLPGKPYIAHLAERMGNECEDYQAIGYDALLGSDMMETVGQEHLEKSFRLQAELTELNKRRKTPFAVAYAVDTHDTGNPFLWGMSLAEKLGPEGMKLRCFLGRFLGWGGGKRPKYEVMGLAELSTGLFAANVSEQNLVWVGDEEFSAFYHRLEDVYDTLKPDLAEGRLIESYSGMGYAWWMVAGEKNLIVFALWYEQIAAYSETGLEHSEIVESYSAKVGEFPFPQRLLASKAGHGWNLRALRTMDLSQNLKIWVIPAKG